jgi:hypothetical protein
MDRQPTLLPSFQRDFSAKNQRLITEEPGKWKKPTAKS